MNLIGTKIDEVRIDGQMDRLFQDLEKIRDMGIDAVELPPHGLDVILNGELSCRRMDEINGILAGFDFIYSVHAPNPINLMDQENPELHAKVMAASLLFAKNVNAKAVVYHGGRFFAEEKFNRASSRRSLTGEEEQRLLAQEVAVLQRLADQHPDMVIAVENARPYLSTSPYSYAESPNALKNLILEVNRPNVGINLDFGHLHMAATYYGFNILAAVDSLKEMIVHTHIHDNFGGIVHHWEKQQNHPNGGDLKYYSSRLQRTFYDGIALQVFQ